MSAHAADAFASLSAEELRRAGEMSPLDRQDFMLGRALLRTTLARYLRSAPGDIAIAHTPAGRPECLNSAEDVRFSVTHSVDRIVFALTCGRDVGVDIERLETIDPEELATLADAFLSEPERSSLALAGASSRSRLALRYWTRKEAYLKGSSRAADTHPRSVDVSQSGQVWEIALPAMPARAPLRLPWSIIDVPLCSGFVSALAFADDGIPHTVRWQPASRMQRCGSDELIRFEGALFIAEGKRSRRARLGTATIVRP